MKRYILPIIGIVSLPLCAQNVVDATRFGSSTITGTARYRAMGGAFGALGGDPSAMSDNPAGMGIYRGTSEISFTPNLSIAHANTDATVKSKQKKADCSVSNLAYIISFKTRNAEHLVNFNIGLGFNHSEGMNRKYKMTLDSPEHSFGAYLANRVNNTLLNYGQYSNPSFMQSDEAWDNDSGIAPIDLYAYDCYAVDQVYDEDSDGKKNLYDGVESMDQHYGWDSFQRLFVRETNRNDEYNINFSGNWDDFIYGGLTMTINDLNSVIETEFDEDYNYVYQGDYIQYLNNLETKGSGFGLKAGVLIKPTDNWRIGFAAHTPTWYKMEDFYNGQMVTSDPRIKGEYSGGKTYSYKYRYQSPWQMQASTALVIAQKALLSFEADMKDFATQKYKADRDSWMEDEDYNDINSVFKDYNKIQFTLKAGAEYRLTDHFSVRAGYIYQGSPYKDDLYNNPQASRSWKNGYFGDDNTMLFDSSTKPNYTLLGAQQYITAGFGWAGEWWHIDLSFMDHKINEKVAAYPTTDAIKNVDASGIVEMTSDPTYGAVKGNHCDLTTNILHWDLTIGLKF